MTDDQKVRDALPFYVDSVYGIMIGKDSGEHRRATTEELQRMAEALTAARPAGDVRAAPLGFTTETITKAFNKWRGSLWIVETPSNEESFAQGYVAGWNKKEADDQITAAPPQSARADGDAVREALERNVDAVLQSKVHTLSHITNFNWNAEARATVRQMMVEAALASMPVTGQSGTNEIHSSDGLPATATIADRPGATGDPERNPSEATPTPPPKPSAALPSEGEIASVIRKYFGDDAAPCDFPMTACTRAILALSGAGGGWHCPHDGGFDSELGPVGCRLTGLSLECVCLSMNSPSGPASEEKL